MLAAGENVGFYTHFVGKILNFYLILQLIFQFHPSSHGTPLQNFGFYTYFEGGNFEFLPVLGMPYSPKYIDYAPILLLNKYKLILFHCSCSPQAQYVGSYTHFVGKTLNFYLILQVIFSSFAWHTHIYIRTCVRYRACLILPNTSIFSPILLYI